MAQNSSSNTQEELGKVFCDSIHGHVELHPLLVKIIDTPQFQRLRNIKQLGGGYFVYPGASHNRFEHSIGVAYLAGVLAKTLQKNQPELEISKQDILCVEIAGLCHDLGHGPFSHLFDQMFMPQAATGNKEWKHEKASTEMFDYLVDKNNLKLTMKTYGLNIKDDQKDKKDDQDDQKDEKDDQTDKEDDLVFIKELILGEPLNENDSTSGNWPYKGRTVEKSFLYEIVSNKQNEIDVDKFDYFARDCHHLGIKNNFDHMRYFKFARVIEVGEDESARRHICSREKEVLNLYEMFHTRLLLYRRVYQHKVTKNVELMIKDALLKANDHITFTGAKETFTLSKAKDDMEAYTKLTDQVIERIQDSTQDEMNDARNLLHRIMHRNLYKLLGEAKHPKQEKEISKEEEDILKDELRQALPEENRQNDNDFFEVQIATFSYGKGEKNPIDDAYFYKKNEPNRGITISSEKVSNFLPERFLEQTIRIFWKQDKNEDVKNLQKAFKAWGKNNGFEVDIFNDSDNKPAQDEAQDEADPSTSGSMHGNEKRQKIFK